MSLALKDVDVRRNEKNRLDTFLLLKCKSDTSNLPWGEMFPADRQNQTRIK